MAVSHVWAVTELIQKNDGSGVVRSAGFSVTSTDDGTSTSVTTNGRVNFEKPFDGVILTRNPGFIEYANLTENDVIGWIQTELGANLGNFEINNEAYIDSVDNPPTPPTVVQALPW